MIIGPDYVFIQVPRTASLSIAAWLIAEHRGIQHGEHHGTDIPDEHRGKFTFTVVRNPLTRLPSIWQYVRGTFWSNAAWRESQEAKGWRALGMPFDCNLERFVAWAAAQRGHQWCSQLEMFGCLRLHAILRFEDLPDCLAGLPFVQGESDRRIPHLNAAAPYALTMEETTLICAHSWADFEAYGYAIP